MIKYLEGKIERQTGSIESLKKVFNDKEIGFSPTRRQSIGDTITKTENQKTNRIGVLLVLEKISDDNFSEIVKEWSPNEG